MVRECYFIRGQNHELRRMNNQRDLGEHMWFGEKKRALANVISRKMEVGALPVREAEM